MTSQTQWNVARPATAPRPESFGICDPKGDVVAVIDDERDAETAVEVVLACTHGLRTPEPLRRARTASRVARAEDASATSR